ncbi:hypothetical protein RGUI_2250 [Rhodovulum sp. P5]|nr:hypothetical protein RGUI_2250 [Rhodovulum sp. P5]
MWSFLVYGALRHGVSAPHLAACSGVLTHTGGGVSRAVPPGFSGRVPNLSVRGKTTPNEEGR